MESQRARQSLLVTVCLSAAITISNAAITIDLVNVGNAGNAADPSTGSTGSHYGAVSYDYAIGRYEVTNSQYSSFLNAVAATDTYGLYNSNMGSAARGGISQNGSIGSYTYSLKTNMGDKPVNYVSWFDAARFSNWMANGQTTGAQVATTTENGAYNLNGAIGAGLTITKNTVNPNTSALITFWLPSEDEWYKAAYYQPETMGGPSDGYWNYPTRSDSFPVLATADENGNISNPGSNVANYYDGADWNGLNGNVTTVGSAGSLSASFYGTFDQGGNVFEWNDAVTGGGRCIRGGSWDERFMMSSDQRLGSGDSSEGYVVGFRIASIPEPSTAGLVLLAGAGWMVWKRRHDHAARASF